MNIQHYNGTAWVDVDYNRYTLKRGIGANYFAPLLTFDTSTGTNISPNDLVRLTEGGTTHFEGHASSGGKIRGNGRKEYIIYGYGYEIQDTITSVAVVYPEFSSPGEIISLATTGTGFTVDDLNSTPVNISYEISEENINEIIQEMMNIAGDIIRITPDSEIILEEYIRTHWLNLSSGDECAIVEFEEGSLDTVLNTVTVYYDYPVGPPQRYTTYSAASIAEYGERGGIFNLWHVAGTGGAVNVAENLLQPDPITGAKLVVGGSKFTFEDLTNQSVTITSTALGIDPTTLNITEQEIIDGYMQLSLGRLSMYGIERKQRSKYYD